MPKGTPTCNSIVNLVYRATNWANVADNAASAPVTNVTVQLHTANLTAATALQSQNAANYTNYAAQTVARSGAGWAAASGGATSNVATISYPQCGASGNTVTHVSAGDGTNAWHFGALNSSLAVSSGITPQFAGGALTITES